MDQQLLLQHMLLQQTTNLRDKSNLFMHQTGDDFTIFSLLRVEKQPMLFVQFLTNLLDPNGKHGVGDTFLQLFIRHILQREEECSASIQPHDVSHPFDFTIHLNDASYPFVFELEEEISLPLTSRIPIYYVSKHGISPKEQTYDIVSISMRHHLTSFFTAALYTPSINRKEALRQSLKQFLHFIRTMTNQLEEDAQVELKETITSSPEMMKSAFMIAQTLHDSKAALLHKIFEDIDRHIPVKRLLDDQDYLAPHKIERYYEGRDSSKPGLTYLFRKNIYEDVDLLFRIELDDRLYAGFIPTKPISMKDVHRFLPHIDEPFFDNEFVYWTFLPSETMEHVPTFKDQSMDDPYFNLFHKVDYHLFLKHTMETIEKLFIDHI